MFWFLPLRLLVGVWCDPLLKESDVWAAAE